MTSREQAIKEMAEIVESIGCAPDVTVLEALYDAYLGKFETDQE